MVTKKGLEEVWLILKSPSWTIARDMAPTGIPLLVSGLCFSFQLNNIGTWTNDHIRKVELDPYPIHSMKKVSAVRLYHPTEGTSILYKSKHPRKRGYGGGA